MDPNITILDLTDDDNYDNGNSNSSDTFSLRYNCNRESNQDVSSDGKATAVPQKISSVKKNGVTEEDVDDEDIELLFGSPIFRPKKKSSKISSTTSVSRKNSVTNIHKTETESSKSKRTNFQNNNVCSDISLLSNVTCISNRVGDSKKKEQDPSKGKKTKKTVRTKATEGGKKNQRQIDKEQRELIRAEKQMNKMIEVQNKKKRLHEERQANGKFCTKEINVIIDNNLASCEELNDALLEKLKEIGYSHSIQTTDKRKKQSFNVMDGCSYIHWERQDFLPHLNTSENEIEKEEIDVILFVFYDCTQFLSLLEQDEKEMINDEYRSLQSWVHTIRSNSSRANTRILFLLHNVISQLSLQWNKGGRRRTSFSPTNENELHDAITWLLMEEQIECEITSNVNESVEFITMMTRALSELPYYEQPTELHCIKKLKNNPLHKNKSNLSDLDKAKDCWKRQLQQIPLLSESKATYLTTFYPTARSLMDQYLDQTLSEDEKRALLKNCIQEGRTAFKMSDCIYRLMTGTNEMELI